MKKIYLGSVVILFGLIFTNSANATYVEFNPKSAKFFSPDKIAKSSKKVVTKIQAQPKNLDVSNVSEDHLKTMISSALGKMAAEGLFKGDKGDKGDSASFSDTSIYVPTSFANQPDLGAMISANAMSTVVMNAEDASIGSLESESAEIGSANINSLSIATTITAESGAYLSEGGDWVNASSKELKENFATITPQSILEKIISLPIYSWNYKNQTATTTHISPVAEDFYNLFGLGNDKSISTIDPAGVALLGIQALDEKINSVFDFELILEQFKKIGIDILENSIRIKNLITDSITVNKLEIGSPEAPLGITIYDRVTKQPVCIYSENNMLKSESGKCGEFLAETNAKSDLVDTAQQANIQPQEQPESTKEPEQQTEPLESEHNNPIINTQEPIIND
jgi:hypothetical protein